MEGAAYMSFSLEERRSYCGNAEVRARICEFFGDGAQDERPAMFLAVGTENGSHYREALPVEELTSWLDRGAEINRSLWDRQALICHFDIEYVNFDNPAYAFLNEERIFALQQPVLTAAEAVLAAYGIHPLTLMTGRGYHLVWQVSRTSKAFHELAALGPVSSSLRRLYATERAPTGEHVTPDLGAAFAGLSLIMEFVAHEVKKRAAPLCTLPVELGAIETGPGPHGREMISLDITEYADPLSSRAIRAPFSVYLKPAQQRFVIGDGVVDGLRPLIVVPLGDLALGEALAIRHDPAATADLAETAWALIPDASRPMKRLIKTYRSSQLAWFHAQFYAQEHDAPALWPETYDRTPLEVLPPCTRVILEHPNDLHLRPGCALRVVRVMLALGWHPRHIGGLIRSKYERNHAWGEINGAATIPPRGLISTPAFLRASLPLRWMTQWISTAGQRGTKASASSKIAATTSCASAAPFYSGGPMNVWPVHPSTVSCSLICTIDRFERVRLNLGVRTQRR